MTGQMSVALSKLRRPVRLIRNARSNVGIDGTRLTSSCTCSTRLGFETSCIRSEVPFVRKSAACAHDRQARCGGRCSDRPVQLATASKTNSRLDHGLAYLGIHGASVGSEPKLLFDTGTRCSDAAIRLIGRRESVCWSHKQRRCNYRSEAVHGPSWIETLLCPRGAWRARQYIR